MEFKAVVNESPVFKLKLMRVTGIVNGVISTTFFFFPQLNSGLN